MKFLNSLSFTCALLLLFLVGCGGGGSGPETFTVSGNVSLDGKPIEKGTISFVPADGKGPTAGAVIKDGAYTAKVTAGSKKVTIVAPKVVGTRKLYDTPDSPTTEEIKESIPAKYNSKTTLTANIQGDASDQNFPLKSK
jgi:hypothetical protein